MVVSIHTLHELEARRRKKLHNLGGTLHRFHSYASRIGSKLTNADVEVTEELVGFHSYASRIGSKSLLERVIVFEVVGFHSYASRIGSKLGPNPIPKGKGKTFPFIRFTNWKQDLSGLDLAAQKAFPFIRFTNWKQDSCD